MSAGSNLLCQNSHALVLHCCADIWWSNAGWCMLMASSFTSNSILYNIVAINLIQVDGPMLFSQSILYNHLTF